MSGRLLLRLTCAGRHDGRQNQDVSQDRFGFQAALHYTFILQLIQACFPFFVFTVRPVKGQRCLWNGNPGSVSLQAVSRTAFLVFLLAYMHSRRRTIRSARVARRSAAPCFKQCRRLGDHAVGPHGTNCWREQPFRPTTKQPDRSCDTPLSSEGMSGAPRYRRNTGWLSYLPGRARCSASIRFVRMSLMRVRWPSPLDRSQSRTCGSSRTLTATLRGRPTRSRTMFANCSSVRRGMSSKLTPESSPAA